MKKILPIKPVYKKLPIPEVPLNVALFFNMIKISATNNKKEEKMKAVKSMMVMVLAVVMLAGCGRKISTGELAKQIQSQIEETWAAEPKTATIRITSFTLVHKGGQQYRGLLGVTRDGVSASLGVDVIFDGESFLWEVTD